MMTLMILQAPGVPSTWESIGAFIVFAALVLIAGKILSRFESH